MKESRWLKDNSPIEQLFEDDLVKFNKNFQGDWIGKCPSCLKYNCIISPSKQRFFCHGSGVSLNLLETTALKLEIISCADNIKSRDSMEEVILNAKLEFGEDFAKNLIGFIQAKGVFHG